MRWIGAFGGPSIIHHPLSISFFINHTSFQKGNITGHSNLLYVIFLFINSAFLTACSMTFSTGYAFKYLCTRFILVASFRAFGIGFAMLALAGNMAKSLTLITTQRIRNTLSNRNVQVTNFLRFRNFWRIKSLKRSICLTSIVLFLLTMICCKSMILGTFSLISSGSVLESSQFLITPFDESQQ